MAAWHPGARAVRAPLLRLGSAQPPPARGPPRRWPLAAPGRREGNRGQQRLGAGTWTGTCPPQSAHRRHRSWQVIAYCRINHCFLFTDVLGEQGLRPVLCLGATTKSGGEGCDWYHLIPAPCTLRTAGGSAVPGTVLVGDTRNSTGWRASAPLLSASIASARRCGVGGCHRSRAPCMSVALAQQSPKCPTTLALSIPGAQACMWPTPSVCQSTVSDSFSFSAAQRPSFARNRCRPRLPGPPRSPWMLCFCGAGRLCLPGPAIFCPCDFAACPLPLCRVLPAKRHQEASQGLRGTGGCGHLSLAPGSACQAEAAPASSSPRKTNVLCSEQTPPFLHFAGSLASWWITSLPPSGTRAASCRSAARAAMAGAIRGGGSLVSDGPPGGVGAPTADGQPCQPAKSAALAEVLSYFPLPSPTRGRHQPRQARAVGQARRALPPRHEGGAEHAERAVHPRGHGKLQPGAMPAPPAAPVPRASST